MHFDEESIRHFTDFSYIHLLSVSLPTLKKEPCMGVPIFL